MTPPLHNSYRLNDNLAIPLVAKNRVHPNIRAAFRACSRNRSGVVTLQDNNLYYTGSNKIELNRQGEFCDLQHKQVIDLPRISLAIPHMAWTEFISIASHISVFKFDNINVKAMTGSKFISCHFKNCIITGESSTEFIECKFERCSFTANSQSTLSNCAILGFNTFEPGFDVIRIKNVRDIDLLNIHDKAFKLLVCQKPFKDRVYQLEKSIEGYKKVRHADGDKVIKLIIPAGAWIVNTQQRDGKIRASEAIAYPGNNVEVWSDYDINFFYRHGKLVRPKEGFNFDFSKTCASGIHFFRTRAEAETYYL